MESSIYQKMLDEKVPALHAAAKQHVVSSATNHPPHQPVQQANYQRIKQDWLRLLEILSQAMGVFETAHDNGNGHAVSSNIHLYSAGSANLKSPPIVFVSSLQVNIGQTCLSRNNNCNFPNESIKTFMIGQYQQISSTGLLPNGFLQTFQHLLEPHGHRVPT